MEAVEKCKKHAQDLDPDFLVIPGVEFTSLKTHLNIIGNKTLMRVPSKIWTRKKVIKEAIDHAHKEGAVVQFNHKDWYFHKKYMSKEWYLEHKIDGFEIYNGFGFVDEEGLDFIKEHKSERTMFASAGTDVHDPAKHYRMYTNVLTQDRTVDGVIKALKEGKTEVYSNIKQEKKEERPEKGKLIKNPRKQKIIKRWKWLNWLGYDLFWYGKIKKIIAFYASYSIITIALAILL